mmetsp:Transcript_17102/g.53387  ORF Transcript_17102/g.53387 Transcript_17102/m.53387 type:complete len:202 (+) Transcript_17102:2091-2696(+)
MVVADVPELVGRQVGVAEHGRRRLHVGGLGGVDRERRVARRFVQIRVVVRFGGGRGGLGLEVRLIQRPDAHGLQNVADLHGRVQVLLVDAPERLDRRARREADLLGAARVRVHKVRDVVDAVLVRHPGLAALAVAPLDVGARVDRVRLGVARRRERGAGAARDGGLGGGAREGRDRACEHLTTTVPCLSGPLSRPKLRSRA